MILNGDRKGIIAEPNLLDDVVGFAPTFSDKALSEAIDRLVMRTVHFPKLMLRIAIKPQRLNIVILHLRGSMAWNIELQCPAKRHVENLHSFANGKDRQTALNNSRYDIELP